MSDLPQISEAEFEVMKIVWKHAPNNTNEITDKLLQTQAGVLKRYKHLLNVLLLKVYSLMKNKVVFSFILH